MIDAQRLYRLTTVHKTCVDAWLCVGGQERTERGGAGEEVGGGANPGAGGPGEDGDSVRRPALEVRQGEGGPRELQEERDHPQGSGTVCMLARVTQLLL